MISDHKSQVIMERIVLGTAGLGGVWGKVDPGESVRTILDAMEDGIMAIDTAPAYGNAELYVGRALQQWRGERPRISTKVGSLKSFDAAVGYYDYSRESMERSVQDSLSVMRLEAVDILFLHDPGAIPPHEAEQVLDYFFSFKQRGYARHLGLGGNAPGWFRPYITPKLFDVLMEYNRLNACCNIALQDTIPYCKTQMMRYYAASPLYMGLLGSRFNEFTNCPPAWLPAKVVHTALKLDQIAIRNQIPLSTMAHRFLIAIADDVSMVIGASDCEELKATLNDIKQGPLKPEVIEEILNTIQEANVCMQ